MNKWMMHEKNEQHLWPQAIRILVHHLIQVQHWGLNRAEPPAFQASSLVITM